MTAVARHSNRGPCERSPSWNQCLYSPTGIVACDHVDGRSPGSRVIAAPSPSRVRGPSGNGWLARRLQLRGQLRHRRGSSPHSLLIPNGNRQPDVKIWPCRASIAAGCGAAGRLKVLRVCLRTRRVSAVRLTFGTTLERNTPESAESPWRSIAPASSGDCADARVQDEDRASAPITIVSLCGVLQSLISRDMAGLVCACRRQVPSRSVASRRTRHLCRNVTNRARAVNISNAAGTKRGRIGRIAVIVDRARLILGPANAWLQDEDRLRDRLRSLHRATCRNR